MYTWLSGRRRKASPSERASPAGQSPSAPPEVKGRLNFSAMGTPHPPGPLTRLTGDHSRGGAPSPSSSVSRLGDYHRSKQNPGVLDQYLSPNNSNTTSQLSDSLYKNSPTMHTNSSRFTQSPHLITGFPSLSTRHVQTPLQSSLFHTGLSQSGHSVSPFGTSLVNMAVRGRLRQSQSTGVSPVIVQLSNPSNLSQTSLSANHGDNLMQQDQEDGKQPDPCSKDAVISALKQKRKRWACHSDDIIGNTDSQPAAKRSRHNTEQHRSHSLPTTPLFVRPSLANTRKRELSSTATLPSSSLSQSHKKPRVILPSALSSRQPLSFESTSMDATSLLEEKLGNSDEAKVGKVKYHVTMPETGQPREQPIRESGSSSNRPTLKLSVPDSDNESDSELGGGMRCGALGGTGGGVPVVKGDGVEESSVDSGRGSRGSTPPVHEDNEDDEQAKEEERARKNRADLQRLHKSLTTVFPSLHKTTSRRKIPVFCATGSVPIQPPTLSSRSVTQEDWRKQREVSRAKLKNFLMSDDDSEATTTQPSVSPSGSSSTLTVSTAAANPVILIPPTSTVTSSLTISGAVSSGVTTSAPLLAGVAPTITTTVASFTNASTNATLQPTLPGLSSLATGHTSLTPSKSLQVPKSVTFQLPNVATSTQSMSSAPTPSTQTQSIQQSSSSTGTEQGIKTNLKPGTLLSGQQSSNFPAPTLSVASQSTSASTNTAAFTSSTLQQQASQAPVMFGLPSSSIPPSFGSLVQSTTLSATQSSSIPAGSTVQPSQTQLTTGRITGLPTATVGLTGLPTATVGITGLPSATVSLTGLPTATGGLTGLPTATVFTTSLPTTTIPGLSNATGGITGLPTSTLTTPAVSTTALVQQPGSQLQQAFGINVTTQPQLNSLLTTPSIPAGSVSNSLTSGNTSAALAMPGGFSFGAGSGQSGSGTGFSFLSQAGSNTQTSTTLQLQQQPSLQTSSAPLQNLAPNDGGFKLGQTQQVMQSTTTTSAPAPTFNFGAGSGVGFSSGSSTQSSQMSTQVAPLQQKPIFGGSLQQPQSSSSGSLILRGMQNNPGGITLGQSGMFGAPTSASAATSSATPSFNFSSSTAPQTQKLSGGMFGATPLAQQQPAASNNPLPTFNFGSSQQQTNTGGTTNMFNFSATSTAPNQQQTLSGALVPFGGGSASNNGSGMFNFSASTGQTGNNLLGTGSSGTASGLQFGLSPQPAQSSGAGGSAGFNFSAGSNSVPGGLSFGGAASTSDQKPMFGGSSTNQIQPGGMFGQQNNSSSTGNAGGLFNSSLTTPMKQNAQQPQFNFTPQPSPSGFNFGAAATGGVSSGPVFGSPGGTLFSAGTPETSRPVATARRRRGRRK